MHAWCAHSPGLKKKKPEHKLFMSPSSCLFHSVVALLIAKAAAVPPHEHETSVKAMMVAGDEHEHPAYYDAVHMVMAAHSDDKLEAFYKAVGHLDAVAKASHSDDKNVHAAVGGQIVVPLVDWSVSSIHSMSVASASSVGVAGAGGGAAAGGGGGAAICGAFAPVCIGVAAGLVGWALLDSILGGPNFCRECEGDHTVWPFSGCHISCGAKDANGCCCLKGVGTCPSKDTRTCNMEPPAGHEETEAKLKNMPDGEEKAKLQLEYAKAMGDRFIAPPSRAFPEGCPVCMCDNPTTWPLAGCNVECGAKCDGQCCCLRGVGKCPKCDA